MRIQHALVPTLLLLASACAPSAPRTSIAPKLGPTGSVRALYDGGLLRRRLSAQFSLDESAYVLIGHLGGDGMISVMFPKRAYPAYVEKGKIFTTASVAADYDAAPEYYFLASTSYRAAGARSYSYDGRGNGFVFMITSRRPLRIDRISDYSVWDDIEVMDYHRMLDPRRAIREYADMLADGSPYTLTYAQSFTAYSYTSYADAAMDCAMLSMFTGPWTYGYGWTSNLGYAFGPLSNGNYCGSSYAFGYGYYRNPYWYGPNRPVFNTPLPNPPVTPVAQRTPRPTFAPSTPDERRTASRRGVATPPARSGDVLSYRPTWAENPTFAPEPTERHASRRGSPQWSSPTTTSSSGPRWGDERPSRRNDPSPTPTTTSSAPASAPAPAAAPAPTMSPGHGSASEPSRRPPSE